MPIRPENRARYPKDWKAISTAIKERAGWRCECHGECLSGIHAQWVRLSKWDPEMPDTRCPNRHGQASEFTGSKVVLTTAHLDHTPEHCEPANLRAMCQGCHLNYDRDHHAETRAMTLAGRTPHSSGIDRSTE
jgi:hypothetical protein